MSDLTELTTADLCDRMNELGREIDSDMVAIDPADAQLVFESIRRTVCGGRGDV